MRIFSFGAVVAAVIVAPSLFSACSAETQDLRVGYVEIQGEMNTGESELGLTQAAIPFSRMLVRFPTCGNGLEEFDTPQFTRVFALDSCAESGPHSYAIETVMLLDADGEEVTVDQGATDMMIEGRKYTFSGTTLRVVDERLVAPDDVNEEFNHDVLRIGGELQFSQTYDDVPLCDAPQRSSDANGFYVSVTYRDPSAEVILANADGVGAASGADGVATLSISMAELEALDDIGSLSAKMHIRIDGMFCYVSMRVQVNMIDSPEQAGDVNNDGTVDADDLQLVRDHISGAIQLANWQIQRADVLGETGVTWQDELALEDHINNPELHWPPVCGDVTRDGIVAPIDQQHVVNSLNGDAGQLRTIVNAYGDTSRDGSIEPIDSLRYSNHFNTGASVCE